RGGFDDVAWREATSWRRKPVENPFRGGLVGKFRLQRVQFEYELAASGTPDGYRKAIARLLQRLARTPDLALVQTHKAHELLAPAANPYLAAKAAFMLAGVPVQSVHLETMEMPDANLPYTLNNVALAAYAKLNGVPWVISIRPPSSHELVIGLGYSEVGEERLGPRSRYVGITTVFQGDGRYLVWGQTREVEFENYADALYATLRSTIEYVRQENNWQAGDHIRLVFHVYKPLKHREMDAIKELVAGLVSDQHPVEYAFLDISRHHEYQLFDPAQAGVYYPRPGRERGLKGIYAPVRGEARQLSARSALLQLIGPEQVKTDAQGAPRPLLIELSAQSDFTDLTYLVRQVFHFSFMSWRSFFPAVEPVTILYSRLIANSLGNFKLTPGWNSNVLTVGTLRSSMWFL
ncbi:MAG: Piwi domain-containing protein, partial [Acetobacteraceae bacterium]|nr:Piwi domain-containing protein [Acetobacteraceae bacterium]